VTDKIAECNEMTDIPNNNINIDDQIIQENQLPISRANPSNAENHPSSQHSNSGNEIHSEQTDEINNMITNMMGEIQGYRNSIRNIVEAHAADVNSNAVINGNGLTVNANLQSNANANIQSNGLIQLIPDEDDNQQINTNNNEPPSDNLNANANENGNNSDNLNGEAAADENEQNADKNAPVTITDDT
jgi:hypothetical protein